MIRYMALVADPQNVAAIAERDTIIQRAKLDHKAWAAIVPPNSCLSLLHDPGATSFNLATSGMLLGRLYRPGTGRQKTTLSISEGKSIRESDGRYLVENFWGSYVAFLSSDDSAWAIRSPDGREPIIWTTLRSGLHLCFSHIDDVLRLVDPEITINWDFVLGFAASLNVNRLECGLKGFMELCPGHSITFKGAAVSERLLWDLARHADNRILDSATAQQEVISTTEDCLQALCGEESALVSLSGGLDSTCLLGLAASLTTHIDCTAINMYARDSSGDERHFARIAASFSDCPLLEEPWDLPSVELGPLFEAIPCTIRPDIEVFPSFQTRLLNRAAESVGAKLLISGQGGDEAFFANRVPITAIDYRHDHGLTARILPMLMQDARLARRSLWETSWGFLSGGNRRAATTTRPEISPYISAATVTASERARNPISQTLERCAPGKLLHANRMFYLARARHLEEQEDFRYVEPFSSQPIVELMMRVPTYLLCGEGIVRSFQRTAFASFIPAEVRWKTGKGSGGSDYFAMLRSPRNRTYIRSLILDGHLASMGSVNVDVVEHFFRETSPIPNTNRAMLLRLITAELWIQKVLQPKRRSTENNVVPDAQSQATPQILRANAG